MAKRLGKFDKQLGILPWDGMLLEVRRSAYRVAWIDERIEQLVEQQDSLHRELAEEADPVQRLALRSSLDEELRQWLAESRREREHFTRITSQCVNAGLTQSIVDRVALETQTMARVLGAALDALELEEDARGRAVDAFRHALGLAMMERREDVLTGKAFLPVKVEHGWDGGTLKAYPSLDGDPDEG